ncbi:class I SAM-dependent DNA methyltransferase [Nostoc sp. DedSLP04]|uniref:type I restriction-modification system subunit M n=1 Tax=Nostoc sp. DedSLP04 TaxID=3075401 RepID=UPI002AD4AA44|nr:class I SAM-dependent DNA methyltransferase [Nostoc sp. DedSLP04]MDZ8035799.1 class I SAM-dependent DNA methyltransferase [Nostoc sp. DedSLP04]
MSRTEKVRKLAGFIWSIAELLRGDYKQADYGKVILPFTVLRRLDCVLEPTKAVVMEFYETKLKSMNLKNPEPLLNQKAGVTFHNISQFTFQKLKADPDNVAANLRNFINGFSIAGREIIEYFNFTDQINRLDEANLLFLIVKNFAEINLHPDEVNSMEMGYVFEELIRKFSELSNETAGEHFTPREVIRLMVNLLFLNDRNILTQEGIVTTIYDPACGTGGMLSLAEEYIKELNQNSKAVVFGQEINPESYAICKSDMLIKGQNISNIKFGNTFTTDGLAHETFDYMLSNPPFGVEWKKVQTSVKNEYEKKGFDGRFGAGLPRISDGSFLFLQHMISKMKRDDGGSRIAIVFNGSPLFSGSAGSGESDIRKWIIENDMLEAITALPDQLFYNTGIYTYIWIITNSKAAERKGKIQLINAIHYYKKMSRSLGSKRNEIGNGEDGKPNQIEEITRIYGEFQDNAKRKLDIDGKKQDVIVSKIFDNEDFGYWRITVERPLRLNFQVSDERIVKLENETAFMNLAESKKRGGVALREIEEGKKLQESIKEALRTLGTNNVYKNRDEFEKDLTDALKAADIKVSAPLKKVIMNALAERDETADICTDKDGNYEPDTDLRDYENVSLKDDINEYMKREVLPYVPDAWVDESKTRIGYEIPFTRHFYEYVPPRPLEEIEQEIKDLEEEIQGMLEEIL